MPPVTRWHPSWLDAIDPSVFGNTHSAPGWTPYQHNNQQVYALEWRQSAGGVRTDDGEGRYSKERHDERRHDCKNFVII